MKQLVFITVMLAVSIHLTACKKSEYPFKNSPNFTTYRETIKKQHGIDIINYTDRLRGGYGDGVDLTKFELKQLLMGIKVEMEHTSDKMTALEITTDHLQEIPDYYTRLHELEEAYEKEVKRK